MSRQLLINNATAVPAADATDNEPNDIAEGRVAAFNPDDYAGGTLDFNNPYAGEYIEFVQGTKAGELPLRTSLIKVSDIEAVHHKAYVAPVAQVTTVVPVVGTGTATLRVVRVDQGFEPHPRTTISVIITGKTKAQITDAFVAEFNKSKPKFITASNSGNDLVLTGDIGVSFATSSEDLAAAWAITATNAPNFGTGTPAHLKILEEYSQAQSLNYTQRINLPVTPDSYVLSGGTYDLFTILVRTNTTANIAKANEFQEITIAVQTPATGIDLDHFFFDSATTTTTTEA